jgi:hypothetical protein
VWRQGCGGWPQANTPLAHCVSPTLGRFLGCFLPFFSTKSQSTSSTKWASEVRLWIHWFVPAQLHFLLGSFPHPGATTLGQFLGHFPPHFLRNVNRLLLRNKPQKSVRESIVPFLCSFSFFWAHFPTQTPEPWNLGSYMVWVADTGYRIPRITSVILYFPWRAERFNGRMNHQILVIRKIIYYDFST